VIEIVESIENSEEEFVTPGEIKEDDFLEFVTPGEIKEEDDVEGAGSDGGEDNKAVMLVIKSD
jgi:hypothetical protein